MLRNLILAGSAAWICGTASAVPVSPQDVSDLLAAFGASDLIIIPTEESTNSQISGQIDGVHFIADTRDCDADRTGCKVVLFYANFDLERDAAPEDYLSMNMYNDRRTWGRAYVLGNQIGVDYAVDLYDENELGQNEIETWQIILDSFREHNTPEDIAAPEGSAAPEETTGPEDSGVVEDMSAPDPS